VGKMTDISEDSFMVRLPLAQIQGIFNWLLQEVLHACEIQITL